MSFPRFIDRDATVSAGRAEVVTPHDSNNLTRATRGLYVGGAGTVVALFESDSASVTLTGVLAGSVLPIRVIRVYSTGTTATGIVALY